MVTEYDENTVKKITRILKFLEKKYGVEGVALVTVEGLRIASAESATLDMDALSGTTVAIAQSADKILQKMGNGNISGLILRGSEGYVLIEKINENVYLIASDKRVYQMGYMSALMRKFAAKVAPYLSQKTKKATPSASSSTKITITRPTTRPLPDVIQKTHQLPSPIQAQKQPTQVTTTTQSAITAPQKYEEPETEEKTTIIDAGTIVWEKTSTEDVEVAPKKEEEDKEIIEELRKLGINPEDIDPGKVE